MTPPAAYPRIVRSIIFGHLKHLPEPNTALRPFLHLLQKGPVLPITQRLFSLQFLIKTGIYRVVISIHHSDGYKKLIPCIDMCLFYCYQKYILELENHCLCNHIDRCMYSALEMMGVEFELPTKWNISQYTLTMFAGAEGSKACLQLYKGAAYMIG